MWLLIFKNGGTLVFRFLVFRVSGQRAVSTMIAGVIVLTLLLTALGTMVFVSQLNDQYQQSVNRMAQYGIEKNSENLVLNSPGLRANLDWSGCSGCNMYNMSLSNLGGVDIQIVRIYVNSMGSGCTSLCVLTPTLAPSQGSYAFNQANQLINAGESNHAVLLYLSSNIPPLPSSQLSHNTISVVTSRGTVFSFQWPIPTPNGGQSQAAFSAGILKIAYQYSQGPSYGYDSSNEPGPVAAGSGGTVTSAYCHQEPARAYQAGAGYAEQLTGLNGVEVTGNNLWFVNPWVTQTILDSAITNGPAPTGHSNWPSNLTTLYIYVNITNVANTPFAINGGSIDLTWYSFNWIDATLIGYYQGAPPGTFYPAGSTHTVPAGASFYAIFKAYAVCLGRSTCSYSGSSSTGTWPPPDSQSVMFLGSASLTSSTTDSTFVAGVALTSGLWIRYSC